MTCIVGIETENGVMIGADSASVAGYLLERTELKKVFRKGQFLIGYAGNFRSGQILQYQLEVPEQEVKDDLEYLSTTFIDHVRQLLEANCSLINENGVQETDKSCFLLGYKNRLYMVGGDFQVNRFRTGYTAIGFGDVPALSSLHTTGKLGITDNKKRLKLALKSAQKLYPNYVSSPFIFEEIGS